MAPGLLSHIIASRFVDHLPLYRQEQIYRTRHGVNLSRHTMMRWLELATDWLGPIYRHIRTGVMAGGYVQVDETPLPRPRYSPNGLLLDGIAPRRRCGLTSGKPAGARPVWTTCCRWIFGIVQCDGYSAYGSFARKREDI